MKKYPGMIHFYRAVIGQTTFESEFEQAVFTAATKHMNTTGAPIADLWIDFVSVSADGTESIPLPSARWTRVIGSTWSIRDYVNCTAMLARS